MPIMSVFTANYVFKLCFCGSDRMGFNFLFWDFAYTKVNLR